MTLMSMHERVPNLIQGWLSGLVACHVDYHSSPIFRMVSLLWIEEKDNKGKKRNQDAP